MNDSPPFEFQIDRRQARAPQVYQALREAILDFRLKPGDPVSENWICQQCGVSRTPAREALIRLAQDELIVVFPQQGSFVAPIRLKKVIEASFIREALEISILKMAAAVWTKADTAAAAAILDRQRLHAANDDHAAFFNEDQNFHHYFAMVAGAEGMSTIINDTATHLVRIRRLTHPVKGRMQQAILDHQNMLDQISSGKVDAAIAGLTQHLSQVFQTFTLVSEQQPEYFEDFNGVSDDIPQAMRRYLSSYVQPHEASATAPRKAAK
jgi:GntR family transcriptional regulator, rspAB operon transcriptional repressor